MKSKINTSIHQLGLAHKTQNGIKNILGKKTILFFVAILFANAATAQQWSPNTASITTNIFRTNPVGIGYSTIPTTFGTNKLMVNGDATFSGNVGIGTTSPTAKLHIPTGNLQIDNGQVLIGNPPVQWNDAIYGLKSSKLILIQSSEAENGYHIHGIGVDMDISAANCDFCYADKAKKGDAVIRGGSAGSFIICNEGGGDIKFETGNYAVDTKIQMLINNKGKIGIGLDAPYTFPTTAGTANVSAYKLFVKGGILTEEVRVALGSTWADYVFTPAYQLPSLTEVEQQIKEKGHLAGVPSAASVKESGIEVGEMAKIQMQKIEELTLYIIEQNKINQTQSKEIASLKAIVHTLLVKK